MATNPMQRKARQSFLLGILITLVIAAVVVFWFWKKNQELEEKLKSDTEQKVQVYVLSQDVKSGQTITADMFSKKPVTKNAVPEDATGDIVSMLSAYSLCDSDGNLVKTKTEDNGNVYLYVETEVGIKLIKEEDLKEQAIIAKVDLKANTVITTSMLALSGEVITDDIREQMYNMISLPIDLESGEYIDIRLMLPNGLDYIVLSKKKVAIPEINGVPKADTVKLTLSEDEILTLSSAVVEAYQMDGSRIYAIKYVEAGNQNAALKTYIPTGKIIQQIKENPNIVKDAKDELYNRWKNGKDNIDRTEIDKIEKDEEEAKTQIKESVQSTKQDREDYLSSLYEY